MKTRIPVILMLMLPALCLPANAQFDAIFKKIGLVKQTSLSDTKVTAGLKEALRVGADKAIALLGKKDGFLRNRKVKVQPPKPIAKMEQALRLAGFGDDYDEFVLSMNRAAEKATPLAKEIFLNAIDEMTIEDAQKILTGGDTAATDYFKKKTEKPLAKAFTPIVKKTMAEYNVVQEYKAIVGQYETIPFMRRIAPSDVEKHTVAKTLDGLFYMLGQQERQIREDPAARGTDLLKEVFGS
jgi:uncharacterized protein DUF4197